MKALLRSGFLALAVMARAVPANAGPVERMAREWMAKHQR